MQMAKKPSGLQMPTLSIPNNHPTSPSTMAKNLHYSETLQSPYDIVSRLTSKNAVVVFSVSGCGMCRVAKRLLFGLGVGPTIVELDHLSWGLDMIQSVLLQLLLNTTSDKESSSVVGVVPAVFVGGRFLGGVETLMACHINGSLVPLLKEVGALWL